MGKFDAGSEQAILGLSAQDEVTREMRDALENFQGQVIVTREQLKEEGVPEQFLSKFEQEIGDIQIKLNPPCLGDSKSIRSIAVEVCSTQKDTGNISVGMNKIRNFKGDFYCFRTPKYTCFVSRSSVDQVLKGRDILESDQYTLFSPHDFSYNELTFGTARFIEKLLREFVRA